MLRSSHPAFASLVSALALATFAPPASVVAQQQSHPAQAGLDTAGMNRSVKPGDDFFDYANGTWLKQTEIPADRSTYSAGVIVTDTTDRRVAELIQEAARADAPAGSDVRKIGDYYTSFMDTTAIDAAGLKPLKPALDSIAAIRDRKDLARVLGSKLQADVDVLNNTNFYTENLFGLWVAQDLDDPTHYSPFLLQGGLGMPDRSYYVDTSAAMAAIRAQYQQHVAAMLGLAKVPGADAKAGGIVRLETAIAKAHASREESGDVTKGNNHWSRADFGTKAPGLDWETYLRGRRARPAGAVRRVAAGRRHRHLGARRERAARHVEGLPDLSRDPVARRPAPLRLRQRERSRSSVRR